MAIHVVVFFQNCSQAVFELVIRATFSFRILRTSS